MPSGTYFKMIPVDYSHNSRSVIINVVSNDPNSRSSFLDARARAYCNNQIAQSILTSTKLETTHTEERVKKFYKYVYDNTKHYTMLYGDPVLISEIKRNDNGTLRCLSAVGESMIGRVYALNMSPTFVMGTIEYGAKVSTQLVMVNGVATERHELCISVDIKLDASLICALITK